MGRNMQRFSVVRYVLVLLVLSLGLSGCETCKSVARKLHLMRAAPPVVESQPPEAPVLTPPTAPVPAPAPITEQKVTEAPRPQAEPRIEEALQTCYFDYDSAVLRDDTRRVLDKDIEWLKANPTVRVQVEGHCDERGTEEYNLHLGERRANAVKQYMEKNGVDASRLFTISYGKDRPVDPGHTETAWAKNRRVQFSRY
jgi:peptidoglycan-associated lipoprotein